VNEQRTHDELAELLAAYALDAVDADERSMVEDHLGVCPRCRAELADHREVTALLAHTGAPAPDGVWDRIARELEVAPPPMPFGQVLPLGRRRRPSRALAVLGAAAAVVVAALSFAVYRQSEDIDDLRRTGVEQQAKAALDDPDSRVVVLRSEGDRARASVVIGPDGQGFVYADTLPALSADETWQLWGIGTGAEPVSLGILGPDPGTVPFRVEGDVDVLAVTRERVGGAVAPTEDPTVAGEVA
jgi:hypothetical protein